MTTSKLTLRGLLLCALLFATLALTARPSSAASATIIVDSLDDDRAWTGTCSLRDAVIASNTNRATDGCPAGDRRFTTILVDSALDGGTIHIVRPFYIQDNVTIRGDIFIDGQHISQHFIVTHGASLTVENMTLQYGKSDNGGGSIRVDSGALAVRTVRFRNNQSQSGGAIVFNNSSQSFGRLYINNSLFLQNTAANRGGAIVTHQQAVIENTTFTQNSAPDGGAIWADADVTIRNGEFNINQALTRSGRGGALYVDAGTMTVHDSLFEANRGHAGMAVYAEGADRFELMRSTVKYSTPLFDERTGHIGAAVALVNTDGGVFSSTFEGNRSNADGGGLLVAGGKVGVWESLFERNQARNGGAVAVVAGGNVLLNQDNISNNSAELDGGGVYAINGSALTMPHSDLRQNRANNGGGLFASHVEVFVDSAEIFNNLAFASGGGVALEHTTGDIQNSTFRNNIAWETGGAVNMLGGAFTIDDCLFSDNEGFLPTSKGGAIWNDGELLVQASILKDNHAGTGGAIYHTASRFDHVNSFLLLNSSTLHSNSALSGGAVAHDGHSGMTITTVRMHNNDARDGSALFNRNGDTGIYGSIIQDNSSNAVNNVSGEVGLFSTTIRNSEWNNCVGAITTDLATYPNTDSDGSCQ